MTLPVAFGTALITPLDLEMLPRTEANGPALVLELRRVSVLSPPKTEPDNAYPAQGRTMQIRLTANGIDVTIEGLLHFQIDLAADQVLCTAVDSASDDLVRYWFLQQVLPIFLLLNGSTELLHATAVHTAQGSVAFLGCSGIGKSTLLHHCILSGDALITDEHLALSRSDYTRPVPSLPFYRPYRSAEDLGLRAPHFAGRPNPLRRMYLLHPADPSAPVSADTLNSRELISSLMNNKQYNVFDPAAPRFLPIMEKRFSGFASLLRTVPLKRLNVPRSLHRLPEVYSFVQQDLAS